MQTQYIIIILYSVDFAHGNYEQGLRGKEDNNSYL